MSAFKRFVEQNFALVMFASLMLGLVVPGMEHVSDYVPPIILAIMMGFAYSRISKDELKTIKIKSILGFYVFRFLIYPFVLFGICILLFPEFGPAILLLALLPSAVSAAPMVGLLGGNISLALAGTVFSSLFVPFIIPSAFEWIGMRIEFDALAMFATLAAILFLPALIYGFCIRPFSALKTKVQDMSGFVSVLMFSLFIVIVVGQLRSHIMSDLIHVAYAFVIIGVFYSSFYIIPWFLFRKDGLKDRIAYTFLSGSNNVGLGVSIAILYFPAREQVYLIVCEIFWVSLIIGFQYFLKKRKTLFDETV